MTIPPNQGGPTGAPRSAAAGTRSPTATRSQSTTKPVSKPAKGRGRLAKLGSPEFAALAARTCASFAAALACFFAAEQIALRWEATGFDALGAVNLASGQTFYGNIGMDWSGDFVIRSTTDDEGQPPITVAVANLRTLTITSEPTNQSPWRLITGLALSLIAAGAAGWRVFKSKRWLPGRVNA